MMDYYCSDKCAYRKFCEDRMNDLSEDSISYAILKERMNEGELCDLKAFYDWALSGWDNDVITTEKLSDVLRFRVDETRKILRETGR